MRKNLIWAAMLVIAIWACNSATQQTITEGGSQAVLFDKPIEKFELPTKAFAIDNSVAQVIETPSGTKIEIPSGAFEDADGNPVSKNVNVNYQEIRTPAEILLSGITMEYQHEGQKHTFQTAGMFRVTATADGKELRLRKGKALNVSMKSNIEGDYNFYHLDEADHKGWTEVGKATAEAEKPEMTTEEAETELAKLRKVALPKKYNSSKDHLVDIEVNYEHIPKLRKYKNLLWKFANEPTAAQLEALKTYRWTDAKLVASADKEGAYVLNLKRKEIKEQLVLEPILVSKDYSLAASAYNKVQEEIKKLEAVIQQNASKVFSRSYPVASLGWHNWDRIYKNPQMVWVKGGFSTDDEELSKAYLKAFVISEGGSVVMRYDEKNFDKMSFDPKKKTSMLVFLNDGNIGTYSPEQFASLDYAPSQTSYPHEFKLSMADKTQNDIKTSEDLDALIANL